MAQHPQRDDMHGVERTATQLFQPILNVCTYVKEISRVVAGKRISDAEANEARRANQPSMAQIIAVRQAENRLEEDKKLSDAAAQALDQIEMEMDALEEKVQTGYLEDVVLTQTIPTIRDLLVSKYRFNLAPSPTTTRASASALNVELPPIEPEIIIAADPSPAVEPQSAPVMSNLPKQSRPLRKSLPSRPVVPPAAGRPTQPVEVAPIVPQPVEVAPIAAATSTSTQTTKAPPKVPAITTRVPQPIRESFYGAPHHGPQIPATPTRPVRESLYGLAPLHQMRPNQPVRESFYGGQNGAPIPSAPMRPNQQMIRESFYAGGLQMQNHRPVVQPVPTALYGGPSQPPVRESFYGAVARPVRESDVHFKPHLARERSSAVKKPKQNGAPPERDPIVSHQLQQQLRFEPPSSNRKQPAPAAVSSGIPAPGHRRQSRSPMMNAAATAAARNHNVSYQSPDQAYMPAHATVAVSASRAPGRKMHVKSPPESLYKPHGRMSAAHSALALSNASFSGHSGHSGPSGHNGPSSRPNQPISAMDQLAAVMASLK